jgi:hypothetical protein
VSDQAKTELLETPCGWAVSVNGIVVAATDDELLLRLLAEYWLKLHPNAVIELVTGSVLEEWNDKRHAEFVAAMETYTQVLTSFCARYLGQAAPPQTGAATE